MKERERAKLIESQANRLKSIISELGITQTEFSKKVEISTDVINKVCTAKRELSSNLALKIEKSFGIKSNWLLTGEGCKYSDEPGAAQKNNLQKQINQIKATISTLSNQIADLENELNK